MAEFSRTEDFSFLEAISSLDGRFRCYGEDISKYFSERAINQNRVKVEIEYLIFLVKTLSKKR